MARPKRNEQLPDAETRLELAFWELLEEAPLSRISIAQLAERAGVNHNTIYYHYPGGVEGMAFQLLEKTAPAKAPDAALMALLSSEQGNLRALSIPENLLRWKHLYLLMHCGSEALETQVRKRILDTFTLHHRIDRSAMSREQELMLEYLYAGMIDGLLKAYVTENDPAVFHDFLQSPLGKASLQAIAAFPRKA